MPEGLGLAVESWSQQPSSPSALLEAVSVRLINYVVY